MVSPTKPLLIGLILDQMDSRYSVADPTSPNLFNRVTLFKSPLKLKSPIFKSVKSVHNHLEEDRKIKHSLS